MENSKEMKSDYYIGGGDYVGHNCPNENFNKVIVPRLIELGIKPENMDEVAEMFADIYEAGYSNGENCVYGEMQEG